MEAKFSKASSTLSISSARTVCTESHPKKSDLWLSYQFWELIFPPLSLPPIPLLPNTFECSFSTIVGKRLVFVTNNSTLSRANYVKKFKRLGIQATEKDIFSSAFATAVYLRNILNFPADKRAYVIGESGIVDELAAVGIETTGASVSFFSCSLPC